MRKNSIIILLILITLFLFAGTVYGRGVVYINIKKPIDYTFRLLPIEIGINYFLRYTKNPIIIPVEFAEDYTVWIKKYSKKKDENRINISFILEFRTRSSLFHRSILLKRKEIKISYDKNGPIPIRIIIDKKTEKIIKKLGIDMDSLEREAFWVGTKITDEIVRMINQEEGLDNTSQGR